MGRTLSNARSALRRALTRLAPSALLWRRGLPAEVAFWERFLATGGAEWPADFQHRFTAGAQIDEPLILACLPSLRSERVSILDVGAGPASSLGSALAGRELELTAVDPLADEYARLLTRYGIEAPVAVTRCRGERIVQRFGRSRFDIAYARNALDHCVDPAATLENMLTVVRPGGFVVLRHWCNEGAKARYADLHQWNIDAENGQLVIWNAHARFDSTQLAPAPDYSVQVWLEGGSVTAVIARRPTHRAAVAKAANA